MTAAFDRREFLSGGLAALGVAALSVSGLASASTSSPAVASTYAPADLRLGWFGIDTNNDEGFVSTPGRAALLKQVAQTRMLTLVNSGTIIGADPTLTAATRFASYDGLAQWDARAALLAASCAPGQDVTLVCNAAPFWMMGKTTTTYTNINSYTVLDKHLAKWADFVVWLIARARAAGVPINNVVWWSELKGYYSRTYTGPTSGRYLSSPGGAAWPSAANRWGYEAATANYNAVYDAVKAAFPTIKVGGPYVTTSRYLTTDKTAGNTQYTGVGPTGQYSGSPFGDGSSVRSTKTVLGQKWAVKSKQLDVWLYWFAHAHGWDFLALDGTMYQSNNATTSPTSANPQMAPRTPWPVGTTNTVVHADGSVVFEDSEMPVLIQNWINAHRPAGDTTPIWWTEAYPGSKQLAADFETMYASIKKGGGSLMTLWGQSNNPRVGSDLWTPQSTPATDPVAFTAIGKAAAAYTAAIA